jgi:subtilisin family serine protease
MRSLARALLSWLAALTAGVVLAAPPMPTGSALPRIVVAFANEQHAAPGPAGSTGSHYAGGGYHVVQSAQQQARRVASRYALHEVASWPIQALSMHCVVFEITDGRSVATVLEALSHDSSVVLAQPLQEFHSLTSGGDAGYNDPLYDLQTNLTLLGIPRAHQRTQGAGVRVALIDTGVDAAHPDLSGRIVRTRSFLSGAAPPVMALRHGTAMAGIIGAVANNHIGIVGIAPQVRIEVFAACWQLAAGSDAAACNTFTLAQALAAALASGAPLVNLSIAGPADPLLAALVQSGLRHGVIFVGAAAGAEAPFPTAIPGVITASASELPAVPHALAAPAQHVLTLRPNGEYDFASGTSVAAAEITGALALLLSAAPSHPDGETLATLLRDSANLGAAVADAAPIDVSIALARLEERTTRGMASAGSLR